MCTFIYVYFATVPGFICVNIAWENPTFVHENNSRRSPLTQISPTRGSNDGNKNEINAQAPTGEYCEQYRDAQIVRVVEV